MSNLTNPNAKHVQKCHDTIQRLITPIELGDLELIDDGTLDTVIGIANDPELQVRITDWERPEVDSVEALIEAADDDWGIVDSLNDMRAELLACYPLELTCTGINFQNFTADFCYLMVTGGPHWELNFTLEVLCLNSGAKLSAETPEISFIYRDWDAFEKTICDSDHPAFFELCHYLHDMGSLDYALFDAMREIGFNL